MVLRIVNSGKWSWVLLFLATSVRCLQCPESDKPEPPVKYPDDYCLNIQDNEEFDFVVVGAGPSGSAVARRLAECPKNKVLLLEAGGNPPPISDIPEKSYEIGLEYRWDFESFNDGNACHAFTGDTCKYNPGMVLGGSSVVNEMMAVRGNPEDFEEWKRMGNYGWGYRNVLPYFKKLENYLAHPITRTATNKICQGGKPGQRVQTVSSTYHATGGPMTITNFPRDPQTENFRQASIKAYQDNGIKFNPDVNSNNQMGVTNIPGTIDKSGYRVNAAKAYLLNLPKNLKVCKYALVHKVNLDTSKKPITVTSVEFVHSPEIQNVSPRTLRVVARKEYILSGGALNSPAILERSGIGIPEILTAAGVEPMHTLNVGENYQDQFSNAGNAFLVNYNSDSARNPLSIEITSLTAFHSFINQKIPDFQYFMQTFTLPIAESLSVKPEILELFESVPSNLDAIAFCTAVLRQGKFGSVHITQSEDPLLTPKIVINQFVTQHDTDVTVNSTRLSRKIMSHPALKPYVIQPLVLTECQELDYNSEEEIMCGAKSLTYGLYHQGGSCYMGPANDSKSVVDPELRVIGVRNLRVVDTSIMPLVTRGNTVLPAMMIGEKAADMIKGTWGQLKSCK